MADNNETLKELKEKHGEIVSAVIEGALYAFKTPTQEHFEDYQSKLQEKKTKGAAFRELSMRSCVAGRESLDVLFAQYPAVPVRIADALAGLAGAEIEFTVKKD